MYPLPTVTVGVMALAMVQAPLKVMLPFSVRVLELLSAMLAADVVRLPAIVAVPFTVIAPVKVVPPFNVAVVPEAIVSDAALIEQVLFDVKVEFVFKVMALVPVTSPGPSKLSVAAEVVPTVVLPVILKVIPDANVSVTVTPFAMLKVAIDPCGRADTEIDVLVFIATTSLLYKFPG